MWRWLLLWNIASLVKQVWQQQHITTNHTAVNEPNSAQEHAVLPSVRWWSASSTAAVVSSCCCLYSLSSVFCHLRLHHQPFVCVHKSLPLMALQRESSRLSIKMTDTSAADALRNSQNYVLQCISWHSGDTYQLILLTFTYSGLIIKHPN